MRIAIGVLLTVAAAAGTAGPGIAQGGRGPRGAQILMERHDGARVSGELLAVRSDSVWLAVGPDVRALPLGEFERVQARRPGVRPGGILAWTAVGGAGTGAALAGACASVSDGCGAVFGASLLLWGLVGGISAAATASPDRVLQTDSAALAPYARFPQGLPADFLLNTRAPAAESWQKP